MARELTEQVSLLGRTLDAGQTGKVQLSSVYFDQVILLPYMSHADDLMAQLPSCDRILIERLARLSKDNRLCPAIIYMRDGQIITSRRVEFSVGMDLRAQLWKPKGGCVIPVVKEAESPNPFLSLSFQDQLDSGREK